jgi:methionyl aminopeptidase
MVILKTYEEIEKMADSGYIVATVHEELKKIIEPGITTLYLNELAEKIIRQHNALPGFLNYEGFPFSICTSINEEIVHGLPSKRKLLEGDIISVDVGVNYNNWYGDAAFTAGVGEISQQAQKLINVTKEALNIAIFKIIPDKNIGIISHTIQKHVEENGFNVVRNYVGHGIGKNLHEVPQVKNYGKEKDGILLKSGMVIAVEPMVTEKNYDNRKLDNNWTVVTKDGGLAAHFEHTIAVTEFGGRILTKK